MNIKKKFIKTNMANNEKYTLSKKLNIPLNKISEYKEVFKLLDKNNTNKILSNDLIKINKIFNWQLPKKIIEKKIKGIHALGKRELNFKEFLIFIKKQNRMLADGVQKSEQYLGNKRKRQKEIN